MKLFKYQMSANIDPKEIWACESCKKNNSDKILLKKWRLIGQLEDAKEQLCSLCNSEKIAVNE
jgi:hypothetical protein